MYVRSPIKEPCPGLFGENHGDRRERLRGVILNMGDAAIKHAMAEQEEDLQDNVGHLGPIERAALLKLF